MTGCPNGCARPYTADLAFVGRSLGLYNVYVGGGLAGDRLVDLYRADVQVEELLPAVRPLLARWAAERLDGEGLGDFYQRILGPSAPRRRGDRAGAADVRAGAAPGGSMSRALVIAAHGSRRDPAANALVRRLAETVRARRLFDEVAVAFHQGEPRFDAVLDELDVGRGHRGAAPHQRGPLQPTWCCLRRWRGTAASRKSGCGRRRRWAPIPASLRWWRAG